MRILKIKGKDETTVLDEIKKEYGETAIMISSTHEKKQGFLGFLKQPSFVATIAINEEEIPTQIPQELPKNKVAAERNQDMNYEATKELLLQLKGQLDDIKNDMHTVKSATTLVEYREQAKYTEQKTNTMYSMLYKAFKEEGIEEEVIETLLEGTEEIDDISEVARCLYTRIMNLLQKNPTTRTSKVVFFVGLTGVGKTTTIAKLTANEVLKEHKKVALFTADTYRIAAIEQLRTYADILNVPIEIIYSEKELQHALQNEADYDTIFVDTAGRSHKNKEQIQDIEKLLKSVLDKKVYLVLNINTTYRDVKEIIQIYKGMTEQFELIITKIDETDEIGNLINIAYYAKSKIVYITDGQNVPDDFKAFDADNYAKALLGRIKYE